MLRYLWNSLYVRSCTMAVLVLPLVDKCTVNAPK